MSVGAWLREAPGRRVVVPAICVEWLLAGAWVVDAGLLPL